MPGQPGPVREHVMLADRLAPSPYHVPTPPLRRSAESAPVLRNLPTSRGRLGARPPSRDPHDGCSITTFKFFVPSCAYPDVAPVGNLSVARLRGCSVAGQGCVPYRATSALS